jgi:nitrate reductase gamma subunit
MGSVRVLQMILGLLVSAAWVGTASACSMCLSATEETRQAYYGTTALLALLPLLLIGGFGFWLRRLAHKHRWTDTLPADLCEARERDDRGEVPSHP